MYFIYYGSLIILIPGIIFSLWAQIRISSVYKRYSKVNSASGWNANEMSRMLLEKYGCDTVSVGRISGNLTDNYNPSTDILSLSDTVYDSTSIAALGVAAHECGHAVQKTVNYAPFRFRSFMVAVTNWGSRLAIPLAIVGIILEYIISSAGNNVGTYVIEFAVVLYSLSTIFSLITLPVEINASRRALKMLKETQVLEGKEIAQARSVLYAAALTYVAALVVSFLYLLRFVMILSSFRRKD